MQNHRGTQELNPDLLVDSDAAPLYVLLIIKKAATYSVEPK